MKMDCDLTALEMLPGGEPEDVGLCLGSCIFSCQFTCIVTEPVP